MSTTRRPASISAVLPAFNEEAVIARTLRRTHAALVALRMPAFEVIVVNDGSTDRTRERCAEVAAEIGGIRLISHPTNRGYGAALRTGFEAATGSAIFLMDSDGQFDPADLRLLIDRWATGVVVCGYRARRSDPLKRRLSHWAFFRLVEAVAGATARDVDCAFKLFPSALGRGLRADGAMISTELLVRARQREMRIVNVPVPHHPRLNGRPTGMRPAVVLRAFEELWRMHADLRRESVERRTAEPALLATTSTPRRV